MNVTFTSTKGYVEIGRWRWPTTGYSIGIDVSLVDASPNGDLDLLKRAVSSGALSADRSLSNFTVITSPVDDAVGRDVRAVVEPDGDVVLVAEGFGPISVSSGGPGGSGPSVTVVNDLTSGGIAAALSAEQGKVLQTTKYTFPFGGVPKADLDTSVQVSLTKADTALQSAPVQSVSGRTGIVNLDKSDVGLGSVDNTSDADKPVSTAQAAAIGAKYTWPAGGIPQSDLELVTQGKINGAYSKPGGGIPKSDLATAVQDVLPLVDAGNNATVGPTIYIPSGAFAFEKLLSANGAVLNGTTDDSAAFQNALNGLPSNRWNEVSLPERVSSVKFDSGITLDVTKTLLHFLGATMDFTGMTSGQALTITGSGTNNTYGQVMGGLDRAFISGPGRTSAVDGVLFTGSNVSSPNTGSARSMFSNCWIRNWRKALTYSHRSYLTTMFNCEVASSLIGVYSAASAYDAYENAAFLRGVIGNNDINIYIEEGLVTIFGTSIDYAEYVQMAVRSGSLQLNHAFVEYSVRNNNYGNVGAIYSGNAPLCAFDLQPGVTSALRNDIGLQTTSPSAGSHWNSLRINGGQWVTKDPRAGTSATDTLMAQVNQGGNAFFSLSGRAHVDFNGFGTQSGYICHNLATWNTVGNYSSPCDWEPGYYNGSSEIPNQIVDNVASYLPANTTHGLSISPAHNLLGSYGISGNSGVHSFENDGEFSENVTIVEDSNGSTTAVLPLSRINGSAGSVSSSASFSHTGSKSLTITKTGAAGEPFKVAIDVPVPNGQMHRPVFRGVMARPATGGPSAGSVNVNMAWIRDDAARIADNGTLYTSSSNAYLVTGGLATSGSAAAAHSASVFKATSGSVYTAVTDLTAGNWFSWQLASRPNVYRPGWATKIRLEFDLKNMGPGVLHFDSLDLQNL